MRTTSACVNNNSRIVAAPASADTCSPFPAFPSFPGPPRLPRFSVEFFWIPLSVEAARADSKRSGRKTRGKLSQPHEILLFRVRESENDKADTNTAATYNDSAPHETVAATHHDHTVGSAPVDLGCGQSSFADEPTVELKSKIPGAGSHLMRNAGQIVPSSVFRHTNNLPGKNGESNAIVD